MDKDIMRVSIDSLAKEQYAFLKGHAIKTLTNITRLIANEKYDEIDNLIVFSPAGDECGEDNYFINFAYDEKYLDIKDIIEQLKSLKELCEREQFSI